MNRRGSPSRSRKYLAMLMRIRGDSPMVKSISSSSLVRTGPLFGTFTSKIIPSSFVFPAGSVPMISILKIWLRKLANVRPVGVPEITPVAGLKVRPGGRMDPGFRLSAMAPPSGSLKVLGRI